MNPLFNAKTSRKETHNEIKYTLLLSQGKKSDNRLLTEASPRKKRFCKYEHFSPFDIKMCWLINCLCHKCSKWNAHFDRHTHNHTAPSTNSIQFQSQHSHKNIPFIWKISCFFCLLWLWLRQQMVCWFYDFMMMMMMIIMTTIIA